MDIRFDVEGMSCAACASAVTRAAKKVSDVSDVSVNLLTNSLSVHIENPAVAIPALSKAIERAGYHLVIPDELAQFIQERTSGYCEVTGRGISERSDSSGCQTSNPSQAPDCQMPASLHTSRTTGNKASKRKQQADAVRARQTSQKVSMKRRLIASAVCAAVLMYFAMGSMIGLPLPGFLTKPEGSFALACCELALLIPVVVLNFRFFKNGFKTLFHAAPTMDTLVAFGATASIGYSVYGMYVIAVSLTQGDAQAAQLAVHRLYFDSAAMILTLISLGRYFEECAKHHTTDALYDLVDMAPQTALVQKGEQLVEVAADEVCVGDILVVKAGSVVPTDGCIIEGYASIDESAITGEPIPAEKTVGDTVVGATLNRAGWFKMRAESVGDDTVFSRIVRMVDEATGSRAPIQRVADKVASVFVPVVVGIALMTFLVWLLVCNAGLERALTHAISVLVISCPCALGLATPTAIMVGTGAGARRGLLVKDAATLELGSRISTVIFDKTGTLTQASFEVRELDVSQKVSKEDFLSALLSLENASEHPLAKSLCEYAQAQGACVHQLSNFEVLPGLGVSGTIQKMPYLVGNARLMQSQNVNADGFKKTLERGLDEGCTAVYCARDNELIGVVLLADVIKPTSKQAVSELTRLGVDTMLLTGDVERAAQSVARQLRVGKVIAGVLPDKKAEVVAELAQRTTVAMVGDGINDAPALACASIGIALGAGTHIAMQTADVVLMRNDALDVPAFVELARKTMRIIKQNLFWAFAYNVICIPLAAGLVGAVTLNPMIAALAMSASSIIVVTNALRLRRWKPSWEDDLEQQKSAAAPDYNKAQQTIHQQCQKETTMQYQLKVEGMMCEKCVKHVTKALQTVEGVTDVLVSLEEGSAKVSTSGEIDPQALIDALAEEEYPASLNEL